MGFKLKSQKSIKQGGFKLMGSSPMKEYDVESKIKGIDKDDYFLDDKGNPIQVSIPEVDIDRKKNEGNKNIVTVDPNPGPIAKAIKEATNVDKEPFTVPVTTKTRYVDGKKNVEKRSYTTPSGKQVREKTKFDSYGAVSKTKTRTRTSDTVTKTKTKGNKTKTKVRKVGSLLNEDIRKKLNI